MNRIIWLYGRPGSGKTTLSVALRATLTRRGHTVCLLDSDHLRLGPNIDLGYDEDDRTENVKRLALIALALSARLSKPFVIVSAVTPTAEQRLVANGICDPLMVYLKGHDRKLWLGTEFEDDPADIALEELPDLPLNTDDLAPHECAAIIVQKLQEEGLLE